MNLNKTFILRSMKVLFNNGSARYCRAIVLEM